jgi:prophage regulatory protein
MPTPKKQKLLRRDDVLAVTALKTSTLDNLLAAGAFPAAVKTSPGTVAWVEAEVQDWIKSRPRVTRGAQSAKEANR